jgi:hypothetical protein
MLKPGEPGEPGDAGKITHLAARYVDTYVAFLDWVASLRGANCSEDGQKLLGKLAESSSLAIPQLRDSADEIARSFNGLSLRTEDSPPLEILVKIALATPNNWVEEYTELRRVFSRT